MQIMIIKLGAMGDVVRTSYAVNSLVEIHGPSLRITWVTNSNCFDLLRFNPFVHTVVTLDQALREMPTTVDRLYSLDDEWDAADFATRVGAGSLTGAYIENGKVLYSDDSAPWFDMGLISKYGKVEADRLKRANKRSHADIFAKMFQVSKVRPAFFGCSTIEADWRSRGAGVERVVGFNLFSGNRWPSKEMPRDQSLKLLKEVSRYLSKRYDRYRLVVFCDKSNHDRAVEYVIGPEVDVWDCSASALDFASGIKACDYVFSTDSLGLHFAIAQKVPNLSYYAPTSAQEIDTFDVGRKLMSQTADYCSYQPCADNSTLTAERVMHLWLAHIAELDHWR
jgi:heptosyltransferase-2